MVFKSVVYKSPPESQFGAVMRQVGNSPPVAREIFMGKNALEQLSQLVRASPCRPGVLHGCFRESVVP